MAMPEPSSGSIALVTGASSGIGAAIARELARRGHNLGLVARREELLRELASELGDTHSIRAEAIAADLATADGRDGLAKDVEKTGLDVAVLVNNAGIGLFGKFANNPRERENTLASLNVDAVVDLTSRYLPAMVERGAGAVINVASTAAFQPMPGNATYAASKAFVLSFSEAVHNELGGTGVTLTVVCPGPVRTEFMEAAEIPKAEERTPAFVWMSAEELARDAIRAAEKGKRAVVPGALNQAGAIAGRHSPRTLALPIVRKLMGRAR
jgi:short-subunit dehydrogenase